MEAAKLIFEHVLKLTFEKCHRYHFTISFWVVGLPLVLFFSFFLFFCLFFLSVTANNAGAMGQKDANL